MRKALTLELREITRKVMAALEAKSGYPVEVMEDADLPTLATIRIPRGLIPAHILMYKPGDKTETPDYVICWQCSMAMRTFDCPPEQRFVIGSTPTGAQEVERLLNSPNGVVQRYGLDAQHLLELRSQLLDGIITHLRSVPIGLRVSETLTLEYPELLDLEEKNVEKELAIASESLSDQIRELMPEAVFNSTQNINAAYALFWAARLEKPEIVNPFRLNRFEVQGQKLLDIYESVPNDPAHDYELIDKWAEFLNIRSWYKWMPYSPP